MFIKQVILITAMLWVAVIPYETQTDYDGVVMRMYYFNYDTEGRLFWENKPVFVRGGFSDEEKAEALFTEFFEGGQVDFMPEDIKLLSANLENGHLSINVSKEILQYGGSYYERCLRNQIVRTALEIPGVDAVTLFIDNKRQSLPEGSWIENETMWYDLTGE